MDVMAYDDSSDRLTEGLAYRFDCFVLDPMRPGAAGTDPLRIMITARTACA